MVGLPLAALLPGCPWARAPGRTPKPRRWAPPEPPRPPSRVRPLAAPGWVSSGRFSVDLCCRDASVPTRGLSRGCGHPWSSTGLGDPPIATGETPGPAAWLGGSFLTFFCGVIFPRSRSAGSAGTAEPRSSPERGREGEIARLGTVWWLPCFAFRVTFKENILVSTRIYLLYSCRWLLARVPSRQSSGPAQFKTCKEKGFFFFFSSFLFLYKAGF